MAESPITILEHVTGISLEELYTGPDQQQQTAWSALFSSDLEALTYYLDEFYLSQPLPIYQAGELVPRLYDLESNYGFESTAAPPRQLVSAGHLWAALMYGHRVELTDPLPPAVGWASHSIRPDDEFMRSILAKQSLEQALAFWHLCRPLIAKNIVVPVRQPKDTGVDFRALFAQACENSEFSRILVSVDPQLAKVLQPENAKADLVERDRESPAGRVGEEERSLTEAYRSIMMIEGHWEDYYADLHRFFESWADSHADLWFPTSEHLDLFSALCSANGERLPSAPPNRLAMRLAEVPIADLGGLSTHDLIAIRLHSDIFQGWREGVQAAYEDLDSKIALGMDVATAKASAAEVLESHASQLLAKWRLDGRRVWSGALRGFIVGVVGSAPSAVIDGPTAIGMAALGGATGLAANLAWDRWAARDQRQAARSVRRHIAALTGPTS